MLPTGGVSYATQLKTAWRVPNAYAKRLRDILHEAPGWRARRFQVGARRGNDESHCGRIEMPLLCTAEPGEQEKWPRKKTPHDFLRGYFHWSRSKSSMQASGCLLKRCSGTRTTGP